MRGRPPTQRPGGPPSGPGRSRRTIGPPLEGTLSAWLFEATLRLTEAGIRSPRTDAQRLASFCLGVGWSDLWSRLRQVLSEADRTRFDELVARRSNGEPLAYITGSTGFGDHEIEVGPGVLVPRPETEVLVEVALGLLAQGERPRVLDLGTGSGAIAIAIAAGRRDTSVHATDASETALGYARRNAARAGVEVEFSLGDLFGALGPSMRCSFDLIAANPPYIPEGRSDLLDPDVLAEPHEALFAGPEGDEVLRRIVAEAGGWLRPAGALVMEVGTPEQAAAMVELLEPWAERGMEPDRSGRPRVVWARTPHE